MQTFDDGNVSYPDETYNCIQYVSDYRYVDKFSKYVLDEGEEDDE